MGEPSLEKADSEIEKMAKVSAYFVLQLVKAEAAPLQFAIDDNAAEAQHGRKSKLPFVHQAEPKTPPTHNTPTLRKELKKLKPTEFREDARIWQLYLEEAEEKAKDKADLWNTGLDSLLIFAGLFAGVVSSFVIDARGDLQEDSQQNLLTGILDMLRDGSIGDIFGIPGTAYWISGLWVISLFTTIFSAIMGVLAKAWLAKYVPATTRREAKDAYHRYKLDRQAERWHLKEVLILVPLLVQIASVLFLIGLIIQIHGDSPTIGRTLLSFCLVGALVYFFMTLFPLIVPSSPFNTPLSEMCDALFGQNLEGEDRSAFKTDIDEGLGEILYTKLIQSPKPFHIDEAIAEVALPAFEPKWTEFLCKNDTPKILLSRFRQCASSRTSDTLQRDETLCNHLLAFLSFAELYEAKLHEAFEKKQTLQGYQTLDKSLHEALEPGNPLHRWNELPDGLRPLLFALRTHVLVLLHLPQNDGFKPHAPSDFNANEMADRPWEMTFQDIRSSHRIHFTLAACRGLIQGENHLKTISSFILSLCLAKAAFAASETGRTSEWASSLTREERADVNTLALRYISKLYHATVTGWEDMAADALREILSVEVPLGDTESTRGHAGVLRCLIFSLSQPSHALRVHAIKMLKLVSSPNPVLFNGIINASVKNIATMTVYDDQGVRDDGLELLIELVKANGLSSHALYE
ncbi:hypothetical protein FA13DRAFT_12801 [Coprinellus micaceus]|uniref:DUF6535 domain-containing protein n=1 Tax=Coprinellus micaceus TaxID=71717 RepID=A0A4Y7U028_COPMI|nr:hypothetical protein FA13DRAFT_12801 [Coprinellus micaceus]